MKLDELSYLKIGVENSIDVLKNIEVKGFGSERIKKTVDAKNLDEIKTSLAAYEEGIATVRNMVDFIYNKSLDEGVDSNSWLDKTITNLVKLSKSAMEDLMKGIIMRLPDHKTDQSNKFFTVKKEILADYGRIDLIKRSLEDILENKVNGTISMEDKGAYEESWCEKFATDNNGKAGYNEEIDAVVIDPDGRIGEIIECYELRIALPPKPTKKEDYLNGHIKTRKSQKWHRERKRTDVTRKTEQRHKKYIEEQFDKKRKGAWFLNNGEATYLTGAHWFLLQWCKTNAKKGGYFHFRQAHKDLFYFMEACYVDERSLGMILVKTRRTGATFATLAFKLCKAITKSDVAYGMTSKTNLDAKKNFGYLTKMFRYLPFWFKPLSTSDDSKTKLEFKQPGVKTSATNAGQEKTYVALETEMDYMATNEDSYDGFALDVYIADEFSKWKKSANTNIDKHWEKVRLALTEGGNFNGIALVLSTVEHVTGDDDPDSSEARSGDKFRYLYYQSDPNERNVNGQTASLLYRLFIPCDENYGGFIDEYGHPVKTLEPGEKVMGVDGKWIKQGIIDYLETQAASIRNAGKLNDFWRKNPRTVEEAFRVASEDCIFHDVMKIIDQINYNQGYANIADSTNELYIRGRFEWVNGIKWTTVKFVEDPNGKFYTSWIPDEKDQNKYTMVGGLKKPLNTGMGAFGIDPYRANKVKGGGSKCGIHGVLSPGCGLPNAASFFLEYIDRERNVEALTEEIIKMCVFYGMKALIENNVTEVVRYMKEWGYRKYSMDRPDKPKRKLSGNDKDYGGMPGTSQDTISILTDQIELYITEFMDPHDEDVAYNMPFNRTLQNWMIYDPSNRTKTDAAVSSSLAILATNKALTVSKETERVKVELGGAFKKYERNGYRSKRKKVHVS